MSGALSQWGGGWGTYVTPLQAQIDMTALTTGVPASFLTTQLQAESGGYSWAQNPNSSAAGLGQMTTATASNLGVDPYSVSGALQGMASYDSQLAGATGSYANVLPYYGTSTSGFNSAAHSLGLPQLSAYQTAQGSSTPSSTSKSMFGGSRYTPQSSPAGGTSWFQQIADALKEIAHPFEFLYAHPLSVLVLVVGSIMLIGIVIEEVRKG